VSITVAVNRLFFGVGQLIDRRAFAATKRSPFSRFLHSVPANCNVTSNHPLVRTTKPAVEDSFLDFSLLIVRNYSLATRPDHDRLLLFTPVLVTFIIVTILYVRGSFTPLPRQKFSSYLENVNNNLPPPAALSVLRVVIIYNNRLIRDKSENKNEFRRTQ